MNDNYLIHYGVLGMKWGVRRYQNKDGTLTQAGRKRAGLKNIKASITDKNIKLSNKHKKYLKTGLIVSGALLAAYGGYKLGAISTSKRLQPRIDHLILKSEGYKIRGMELSNALKLIDNQRTTKNPIKSLDLGSKVYGNRVHSKEDIEVINRILKNIK